MSSTSSPLEPGPRGAEFRGRRAASNTLVVFAGQFFVLLIALVTTPIALNKLGLVEFGVWTIAISFVNYITVVDPGFSDLVTRYGAQARVRGDRLLAARISTIGTAVWLVIGLVLTPLVLLCVPWVMHFVHVDTHQNLTLHERNSAVTFFIWSFFLVIFGSILSTVSGQLSAIGDQWLVTAIDVSTRVLYAITLLILLFRGWQLNAIIVATSVQYVASFIVTLVAVGLRNGRPYADPRKLDPELRRELFRFGGWLQFNSILDTLTYETDPVVLGLLIGADASGIWSVAQRLSRQVTYFANVPQSNVLPGISASYAANEGLAAFRRIYIRSQRIVMLFGAFLAGTIIAFGPVMLKAWLGQSFTVQHNATVATILVAITMVAGLPRQVTANAILAMGRIGLGVRAQVLAFVVNVVLTLALVGPLGLDGVLLGTVIAKVVATTYLLLRFSKMVESHVRDMVWPWLGPLVLVTAVTGVAGRFALHLWPSAVTNRLSSIVALATLGLLFSVLYAIGLRLTKFFSRDDLTWLKGVAPGKSGRLLTPRAIRALAGSS